MKVAAFYRFADLTEPRAFAHELTGLGRAHGLLGTVLVAAEGINGTLAGDAGGIRTVLARIESALGLDEPLEARWSETAEAPFRRLRVRVKREIVTLGRPDLRPHDRAGTYVDPCDWNALLENPDVLVVDTRNRYEIDVGTFAGAINPGTDSFRDFPGFARELAARRRDQPVAMFCTGGIRCEKATALMLELGFEAVYQLRGGVLRYLEEVQDEDNRWQGECFVFDTRVAVDRELAEGDYVQCHACRRPLGPDELASPDYREGVSCPHCIGELDADRAARLEERRRQVALAAARGEKHIGPKQGEG